VLLRICEFGDADYAAVIIGRRKAKDALGGKIIHVSTDNHRSRASIIADDYAEFLERALTGGPQLYFQQLGFEPGGCVEIRR
jgi:hypothetical protein